MKLEEAIPKVKAIIGIKFKDLYSSKELQNIIVAKGDTGKLLEKIIGLPPGNSLKDFEDGELKTNKVDSKGIPIETMFITQISKRVDELLRLKRFEETWLIEKIDKLLYVPVVKISENPNDWYFFDYIFVEIKPGGHFYTQLSLDYDLICNKMIDDIENGDGEIHTSSGKYIQIRTKDAKPYNPIYSNKYQKLISNKNFAFYFKKEFMMDLSLTKASQIKNQ